MKIREALQKTVREMRRASISEAENDAMLLLEYVLDVPYGWYYLHQEDEMPAEKEEELFSLAEKRCNRIPLQQITGIQEFMGLPFRVTENVLIPRQDTEVLAEEAIKRVHPGARVLDLCTGSGCLAVSIAHACPQAAVLASDISEEALEVAAYNARSNGTQIEFVCSDLFAALQGTFDLIVSNPPYIESAVIETLMPEVRDYEPRLALDGGTDGLDFYRRIVRDGQNYLKNGGWLLLEIGADQGSALQHMLRETGYQETAVLKDLAGLDRVAVGRKTMKVE